MRSLFDDLMDDNERTDGMSASAKPKTNNSPDDSFGDANELASASPETVSLDELFATKKIALRRGRVFDVTPAPLGLDSLHRDRRIEGMLVGVAVGDALGHSTEWKFDPISRHDQYGTILDHLTIAESRAGRISDDTQMTFWLLESLLKWDEFRLDDVVQRFVDRRTRIVGMGSNTASSLARHERRLQNRLTRFHECAGDPETEGRGNGALMRFSPMVLPHVARPTTQLWQDAVLSALITHGNTIALSSAIAMTHLLWEVLRLPVGVVPQPHWWIDEYVRIAGDLEAGPLPCPLNTHPIPQWFKGFRGTLCDFLDEDVRQAFQEGIPLRDACSLDGFGSRADCAQTVPAVVYTLMCHADSFESSIIAAVNDTKDNDTVAAIVGAFVGALHGRRVVRQRWIDGIRSSSLIDEGGSATPDREVIDRWSVEASRLFLAKNQTE